MTKPASAAARCRPCPSLFSDSGSLAQDLVEAFLAVRDETERRAAPLTPEDQLIQSMPDASPAKWHRAHTTWFFEQFLLGEHCDGYTALSPGLRLSCSIPTTSAPVRGTLRHQRGHLTRPGADEVTAYRRHVDAAVVKFFHDGQMRTTLASDRAAGGSRSQSRAAASGIDADRHPARLRAKPDPAGLRSGVAISGFDRDESRATNGSRSTRASTRVGHADDSFHFDNEKPAHRALVGPVTLARNLVTNAEWLAFMKDGGYATPTLWLMDGFAAVEQRAMAGARPLARDIDGEWQVMTLGGLQPVDPPAPVCHVSYYEADAFARWSGKHLPTEMEWEVAARAGQLNDAFGIVWQWTRSAYAPIPAIAPSKARSANITASSWSTSWCCAAPRLQPRTGTAVSPIATSSIPIIAGNSPDCASPTTPPDFLNSTAPESAFRRVS